MNDERTKRLTSERAAELGRLSGLARQARRRKRLEGKLTVDDVERAFGALESLEDAQRRLERLGVWAAAGLVPGSVAGAAVRSVEVWLKASEAKLTREVVEDVKAEVDKLKAELSGRRMRVAQ